MKNANLIATLVGAITDTMSTNDLKNRLISLIQAHPEEVRENALAILFGKAELTVRPIEQVEARDDTDFTEFSLSEWNTGCVKWH